MQANPVDIIKEAILLNAKLDCNPIIIADKPSTKSMGRTISCLLPEDKLGQLHSWARNNNAKKLALFTESLPFWTSKTNSLSAKGPSTMASEKVSDAVKVPIAIPEELSKNNEGIDEVTDVPKGAQGAFATTETKVADSKPVVMPILIPEE